MTQLVRLIDSNTKENVNYEETDVWHDGSPLDDEKVDGVIYRKKGSTYYKKVLPSMTDKYLRVDTMDDMRNLTSTDILLLKMGHYKGVELYGYYVKGDTPSPIQYFLSDTEKADDGGSVIKLSDIVLIHDFKAVLNVLYFGAKSDGVYDNAIVIQNAIDFCLANNVALFIPEGVFRTTSGFSFQNVKKITNTEPFGINISGSGMRTLILLDSVTIKVLFELTGRDASNNVTDIQFNISNLQCRDLQGASYAIRINKASRYSTVEKVRLYGFRRGHIFIGASYGISFTDCYIRGCKEEAITVSDDIGTYVITELRYTNCYIDNNGQISNTDNTKSAHVIRLHQTWESRFVNCVIEGNYGAGIRIQGNSHNILFQGCRFEESLMSFGEVGGTIHSISNTVTNINFRDCFISWRSTGVEGSVGRKYNLFSISNNATFENCNILDESDIQDETLQVNPFFASPVTAVILCKNIKNGYINTAAGAHKYKVNIPFRHFATSFKEGYIFSDKNGNLRYKKSGFPTTDTDGYIFESVIVKETANPTGLFPSAGMYELKVTDKDNPDGFLFAIVTFKKNSTDKPSFTVIASNSITVSASNAEGTLQLAGATNCICVSKYII